MRRADRLFQIVQHLRGRRLTTAAQLAGWLEVSERTIYRDIRDLSISGVPVEGEAGVGYRLSPAFDLPPLMFTMDEVEALVAGARMVEAWGGPALGGHARSAVSKIALALPKSRREEIERTRLFAPVFHIPQGAAAWCESRNDFRNFRLDRIGSLEMGAETFQESPGQALEDYLKGAASR
jgi:predicted DNA-binding transcriptional regulator YafY